MRHNGRWLSYVQRRKNHKLPDWTVTTGKNRAAVSKKKRIRPLARFVRREKSRMQRWELREKLPKKKAGTWPKKSAHGLSTSVGGGMFRSHSKTGKSRRRSTKQQETPPMFTIIEKDERSPEELGLAREPRN